MKDINTYIEQELNGKPELKPDEKHRYLGEFQERAWLSATYHDTQRDDFFNHLDTILQKHDAVLRIHSQLPNTIQNTCMQHAQRYQRNFTIVTRDQAISDTTIVLVYAAKEAIHIADDSFTSQFPPTSTQQDNTPEKKISFWQRLRHYKEDDK